jgi:hypothetical protein
MILDVFPGLREGKLYAQGIPRSRGSGDFVGCSLGLAGGRYRLIMSCIDRERFVFMNEPAHS